jgi:peroxiredoxin
MERDEDGAFIDPSIAPRKDPGERLEAGDQVHEFFARTVSESVIQKQAFASKKVWIAFYRYAGCPMCASHFDEVLSLKAELKSHKVSYMAVFDSRAERIPPLTKRASEVDFYVVSNDSLSMFDDFAVGKSWAGLISIGSLLARVDAGAKGYKEEMMDGALNRMPAHFLVDEGGIVAVAHYGKHAGDHIDWRVVKEFFRAPPAGF